MDKKYILLFISVLVVGGIVYTNSSKQTAPPLATVNSAQVSLSISARLKIPKLNIDSKIDSVGLTKDGKMDVPAGPDNTAWFNLGPHIGEVGNAVIDGHSGWKDGIPAVFDNLYKLSVGDKIYVEEKGITTTFIIRKMKEYSKEESPIDVFVSKDKGIHLNLITCAGDWNDIEKSHSKRLVVFADKE